MRGPPPKPAHLRQRTNRTVTAAMLPSEAESRRRKVPPLPKRDSPAEKWHPRVAVWWKSFWRSPMAAEVMESDQVGGLYLAAEALHRAWTSREDRDFYRGLESFHKLMVEFGGSPIARRRLQWEVDKGERAVERTTKRRTAKKLDAVADQDPRDVLKMVS